MSKNLDEILLKRTDELDTSQVHSEGKPMIKEIIAKRKKITEKSIRHTVDQFIKSGETWEVFSLMDEVLDEPLTFQEI